VSRAQLNKDPREVAAMFDDVASRYDLTNDVLSAGRTKYWRRCVVSAVNPQAGEKILDLAAGTGTSSVPLAATGASVVSCDFSIGMLRQGARQFPEQAFVAGDALALPFADQTFDAVTISFGLRNLADTEAGLAEMARVTKANGRLVVCEFSAPTSQMVRTAYLEYLMKALPPIATRVSSNPAAYVYLAESIRAWPDQAELARLIAQSGWSKVQFRNLTFGIVALHRGVRPEKNAKV